LNKFILLFLTSIVLFAGDYEDIDWEIDFKDAMKVAKYQKKPTMVLITQKRCKWCKKMKKKTLSNDAIIDRLNENFVTVEVTRRKDDYPHKELRARAVPTIYFLSADGEKLMRRPVIGYWNVENFMSYINKAEKNAMRLVD
jgi:thioredoxin-related protein